MKTYKELLEEEKQELFVKEAMPAYNTGKYTLDDYYALPEDEGYEIPMIYDETGDIPVKLYDGNLKIHMKEVFDALKHE